MIGGEQGEVDLFHSLLHDASNFFETCFQLRRRKKEGKGCICLLFCFDHKLDFQNLLSTGKWLNLVWKFILLGATFFIGFLKVNLVFCMYSSLGRWSQIISGDSDSLVFSLRVLVPGLGYFGRSCWKYYIFLGWRMVRSLEAYSLCPFYLFVCLWVGIKALDKSKLFSKGNAHCFSYSSHQNCFWNWFL